MQRMKERNDFSDLTLNLGTKKKQVFSTQIVVIWVTTPCYFIHGYEGTSQPRRHNRITYHRGNLQSYTVSPIYYRAAM